MIALFFTFLTTIAITLFMTVNIVVGCLVAIQLGYGPPDWKIALNLVIKLTVIQKYLNQSRRWVDQKSPAVAKLLTQIHVPEVFELVPASSSIQPAGEESQFDSQIEKLAATPVENLMENAPALPERPETEAVLYDEALASALMDKGTEAWLLSDKHVETQLIKLNIVMMKSGRFVADLDYRIRQSLEGIAEEALKKFADELKDDCRNYLTAQANITEQIKKRIGEFGSMRKLAEDVEQVNREQSEQMETTLKSLDTLVASNSQEAAGRLMKEISGLRFARHRLRDMQEQAFIRVAIEEKHVGNIPRQLFIDEVYGIRGRIGLEVTLLDWWKQKRQESRPITFALLDFVKFSQANEEYGITVCNMLIKNLGNALKEQFETGDLIGIYKGNCFLIATVNAGLQKTVTEIERTRQRYEKTTFRVNDMSKPIKIQLTGAIAEAAAGQGPDAVLSALDKALSAAKAAGGNQTFQLLAASTDQIPTKIDAPNFALSDQEIILESQESRVGR
jgi:diguanylate cyclase (GGDEF)-like protein